VAQRLRARGADWTIVRSAFMAQNFNESYFVEPVRAGEVAFPADLVKMLTDVFTEVLDGHNAYLTDGVQRALGRAPRDFADDARDDAATGIWDAR
jgi:hypothetical protein